MLEWGLSREMTRCQERGVNAPSFTDFVNLLLKHEVHDSGSSMPMLSVSGSTLDSESSGPSQYQRVS